MTVSGKSRSTTQSGNPLSPSFSPSLSILSPIPLFGSSNGTRKTKNNMVYSQVKNTQNYDVTTRIQLMFPGSEGAFAYRLSVWLSTFTLAVSIGAMALLPLSIISHEILGMFPGSYYVQWLNASLIQSLWNQVFVCSNLCLFLLMPFTYFFSEAEGFPGYSKGVMARVYEVLVVLGLLGVGAALLIQIGLAILADKSSLLIPWESWPQVFEFCYSCISALGVLITLLCTPFGFSKIFSAVGSLLAKPSFLRDIGAEITAVSLEKDSLYRNLEDKNSTNGNLSELREKLSKAKEEKRRLEKQRDASPWQKNLFYPLTMMVLFALMVVSMLMVLINVLRLSMLDHSLPLEEKSTFFGQSPSSLVGKLRAVIEVIVVIYVGVCSLCGLYCMPVFRLLIPKKDETPIHKIIANCIVLLILSSALPILARTLGLTRFDLLGSYGSFAWLGDFWIVLSYNLLFEVFTAMILMQKMTKSLVHEASSRLVQAWAAIREARTPTSPRSPSGHSATNSNAKLDELR
eukprot:m.123630 g.123630  ORF g.123630 m.123630 type:complete len:516 (+) comp37826_c0_seq4:77-1624(+)